MANETWSRNLLQLARLQAGMSQMELARAGKTSQSAVSAYESGKRSPSVETLSRLLKAAGFELRMQLSSPDTHDSSRREMQKFIPKDELVAHIDRERKRVGSRGRGAKT
jgi:transcriptional regulator with XRE-family HTH domain